MLEMLLSPETGLRAVAALLAAKVVLATLVAVRAKEFDVRYLPEFVRDDVLPYGGGLTILWLLSEFDPVLAPLYAAGLAGTVAMLLRQCWEHAAGLFNAKPPQE